MPVARVHMRWIALCVAGGSSLRRDGPCPNCPLTAWAALPFSFLTSQINAEPAMRCGSEQSRRIDPRGMLDARALCLSLLFAVRCFQANHHTDHSPGERSTTPRHGSQSPAHHHVAGL